MISSSSSNPEFQDFENQRVRLQNGIESCTDSFSLDPQPWIHDLNTISASFQNDLEDDIMHDLALITAQAAMKRLKNFHWILNTGKELSVQMREATEKFKTLSKKISLLQDELAELIADFGRDFQNTQEDDSAILERTWKEIDNIDIEFLKLAARKEIKAEYNNIQNAIQRCKKEGLSFTSELAYAEDCLSASQERILSITPPMSPTGMPPKSQIFIATTGTQNSLARTRTSIYIKYGMRCLEARIEFYLKRRFFECGPREDDQAIKHKIKQITNNAEEQLTWGEGGKPSPSPSMPQLPPGLDPPPNIAPPLLPLETINAITDKFIKQARTLILPKG